jgi:nucleotide-binding universal stress UspA family protein
MPRHDAPPLLPCKYGSILVSVDVATSCQARVKIAVELSERFESCLIGCAAQPIVGPLYFETIATGVETFAELEERRAADALAEAKDRFLRDAGAYHRIEWRQERAYTTDFLVRQARAADLVIVSRPSSDDPALAGTKVEAGDLLMRAGRPVLFVPPGIDHLSAKRIVIGWKDTREARRAVTDSLPILTRAAEVTVLSIGAADSGATDVANHLACHGIAAFAVSHAAADTEAADELVRVAQGEGADLIVCGGYGHSRAREWIFGGVTRSLLDHASLCCLLTH